MKANFNTDWNEIVRIEGLIPINPVEWIFNQEFRKNQYGDNYSEVLIYNLKEDTFVLRAYNTENASFNVAILREDFFKRYRNNPAPPPLEDDRDQRVI